MIGSSLWYKIGDFVIVRKLSEEDADVKIEEILAKLAPYFYEDCVVPIGTKIGPDADVHISVNTKTNKTLFSVVNATEFMGLPHAFTMKMWRLHVYEILYAGVSKGGTVGPMEDVNKIINDIAINAYPTSNKQVEKKRFVDKVNRDTKSINTAGARIYKEQMKDLDKSKLLVHRLRSKG